MLKTLIPLSIAAFASVGSPASPLVSTGSLPGPTDCIRYDQVVCFYYVLRENDLAAGRSVSLTPSAGLPPADHVELRRIDENEVVLFVYFSPNKDLQGVPL